MKNLPELTVFAFMVPFFFSSGCGPGWEGYEDNYSDAGPVSTAPWEGEETVFVTMGETTVEVPLAGLDTHDYRSAPAVLLSDLIINSGLTGSPESFRYDMTATDGYNLYKKRYEDLSLLPSWTEMTNGYLYYDARFDDLTSGWTQHPWGTALSAYQVKCMNGGTITLLPGE